MLFMRSPLVMKKYLIALAAFVTIALNPCLAKATIILLVSTYDGFVVAADSRLTLSTDGKDRIASDSYLKIVRMGRAAGLAFSGTAFLLDKDGELRKIGSLIEEFKIKEKSMIKPLHPLKRLPKNFRNS